MDCQFLFHWATIFLHMMRTVLNHIKNETLDEIKTSLENLWQRMIQLSEFFQYSFVLILKRKCLVRASRVRCWESGTPSTIIYTQWSSRRYELGCDAPMHQTNVHMYLYGSWSNLGHTHQHQNIRQWPAHGQKKIWSSTMMSAYNRTMGKWSWAGSLTKV